jgi:non-specific serine/threonine protein kinase
MVETLHIHLMNGFQVFYGDQPLVNLNSPRLQAFMAYLLLHRDIPQPRQRLAFLLWPDSSESQARTNLRNLLHVLRHTLPNADNFLNIDSTTLQWRADSPYTLDVHEFEVAVAQAGTSKALLDAAALYTGDLLPGCYDEWIQPERERLQEQHIEALERLAALFEQEQDYRMAIRVTEKLLRFDPLREETYRGLMQLHAKMGDRLGLRRVYQTCAAVLERELGVEVSQATKAAYQELVKSEGLPAVPEKISSQPRTNNLPLSLTSFIGREQHLIDLQKHLLDRSASRPRIRLLTLTGAGGCGKTRLSIETAGRVTEHFPDGVWLVELAALTDPNLVAQAVADVLDVREQPGSSLLTQLVNHLETRQTLLILDNCEHLLAACARLAETLLRTCPQLQILATSRERLNLAGEMVWFVPPLTLPDQYMFDAEVGLGQSLFEELKRSEAIRLFVDRATAVLPTFELCLQNAPGVLQICRRVDGIPLAIELAATRVRSLSIEQIAARLDDRFNLLQSGSRTALPRHQRLWDLIDWSYELLPPDMKTLFRRLVVFSGGWSLEAAEGICLGSDIEPSEVQDLIARLVDDSLVTYDPQENEPRYGMYETIREYGIERLKEAREAQTMGQRHRDYFLQWAERLEPELRGPRQRATFDQLDHELDNLRAALNGAAGEDESDPTGVLKLAVLMTWFWIMKGYLGEGIAHLEAALDLFEKKGQAPVTLQAQAYCSVGLLIIYQGNFPLATTFLERGISILESVGDAWALARMRCYWAYLLYMRGERPLASTLWETDMEVFRQQGDTWGLGWMMAWRGRAAREAKEFEAARLFYSESARLLQRMGDEWAYSIVISHSGMIELVLGNYSAARQMFEMRLATGEKLNSITHIHLAHAFLGETARREGNAEEAAFHFREHLYLTRKVKANQDAPTSLAGIAWALSVQNQWRKAVILYTVAERLKGQFHESLPENEDSAWISHELASACTRLGESDFARAREEGRAMTIDQAIPFALIPE